MASQQQKDNSVLDTQEDAKIIRERLQQLDSRIAERQSQLVNKQFYREYELMSKELLGLEKQNANLKEIQATVKSNLGL